MALDLKNLREVNGRYAQVLGIERALVESPNEPSVYDAVREYLSKREPEQVLEELRIFPNVVKARGHVRPYLKAERENYLHFLGENLEGVLNSVPAGNLLDLAIGLPDKNKRYLRFEGLLKQDPALEVVRQLAKEIEGDYKLGLWKSFCASASPNSIARMIGIIIQEERRAFISQITRKVRKGKRIGLAPDSEKVQPYLARAIPLLPEPAKEEVYSILTQKALAPKKEEDKGVIDFIPEAEHDLAA